MNSTVKLRELEEKWAAKQAVWDRERRRMFEEGKQLKERLEVLRNMNVNLQKLANVHRKKAEQADVLVKRCLDLEESNKKLIVMLGERVAP